MTISLLAYLACERGEWGCHLIIVPTSVMLNWEMELKKWCPALKILTYYGSQKERRQKRQGWSKQNSFHVCITSYKLVVQDQIVFRRKKWNYLILDEAQHIKNFQSQRWQVLLNFNASHRILLTGTPLQNDLMELWSLMHFLMPDVFRSHSEFKEWFCRPVSGMIEGSETFDADLVSRLHGILRPFLLRRLKMDVEQQLPPKFEHVILCPLSKRQRLLYDEFISSRNTVETLESSNYMGVMNVLMQLRKVCNHPDLFEVRPIISSYDQPERVQYHCPGRFFEQACTPSTDASLRFLNLNFTPKVADFTAECERFSASCTTSIPEITSPASFFSRPSGRAPKNPQTLLEWRKFFHQMDYIRQRNSIIHTSYVNTFRSRTPPVRYGWDLRNLVTVRLPAQHVHVVAKNPSKISSIPAPLRDLVQLPATREKNLRPVIEQYVCVIPKIRAPAPELIEAHPDPSRVSRGQFHELSTRQSLARIEKTGGDVLRRAHIRQTLFFPDRRLIEFDCGKLQKLADLLRQLKNRGSRALIFTQMSRVLDVLEIFLSIHGHTYFRLDGSTKVEQRQALMERFNNDKRIFLFILSTRSGGVGINLTGADTVIFYDSDWNPAMDAQAQDRCHRIGQTREVHIYRLISEKTVEENILKKAQQKRLLDNMVIQQGQFTTDFFSQVDLKDLFGGKSGGGEGGKALALSKKEFESAARSVEDNEDVCALDRVEKELDLDREEFSESSVPPSPSTPLRGPLPNSSRKSPAPLSKSPARPLDPKHAGDAVSAQIHSIEEQLDPIELYALCYLRNVGDKGGLGVAEAEKLDFLEREKSFGKVRTLKDEEDARLVSEEDALCYEV